MTSDTEFHDLIKQYGEAETRNARLRAVGEYITRFVPRAREGRLRSNDKARIGYLALTAARWLQENGYSLEDFTPQERT